MKKSTVIVGTFAAVAVSSFVAYKLVTDAGLRERIKRNARDAFDTSRRAVSGMSEDVALRTAQMTKNPKINQEWVEHQWETVGF